MKKVFNLKSFWIAFAVSAAVLFVVSANVGRDYVSETDVLIIPKSTAAAENANQIIENLKNIPLTLSFYDKMAQENADVVNDAVAELPDYKRKDFWNGVLQVTRVGNSGVLKIIAKDTDSYQAEVLSAQATTTLISSVGLYYDIKADVDVRMIDSTITAYSNGTFSYALFIEGLVGIFIVLSVLFYAALTFLEKEKELKFYRPNFFPEYRNPFSALVSKKTPVESPVEEVAKDIATKTEKAWSLPVAEEKPYTDFANMTKSASAPANLPIAEEDALSLNQADTKMPEIEIMSQENELAMEEKTPLTHEATDEEVKARLNKLLSGKL